jgi:hypothetical protein
MQTIVNELHIELLDPTDPGASAEAASGAGAASADLPIETLCALALRDERQARLADD